MLCLIPKKYTSVQIYRHTHIHTYIHVHISVYAYKAVISILRSRFQSSIKNSEWDRLYHINLTNIIGETGNTPPLRSALIQMINTNPLAIVKFKPFDQIAIVTLSVGELIMRGLYD